MQVFKCEKTTLFHSDLLDIFSSWVKKVRNYLESTAFDLWKCLLSRNIIFTYTGLACPREAQHFPHLDVADQSIQVPFLQLRGVVISFISMILDSYNLQPR